MGCVVTWVIAVYTLQKAGLFQPKVGSNMDKPKCCVKNVIKKITIESESWSWVKFLNYIFNPTFGFVHLPNFGLKTALFRV